MEHFLQRIHHLLGGVAGPGHHVQFGGVVDVMVHYEFRILYLPDVHQGGERHAGSVRVRDKEAVHLFQAGAVFALCLDIHLPLLAEGIEVIDEGGTVVGGQNAVGHVNIHLVEFAFFLVQVHVLLRHVRHHHVYAQGYFRTPGSRFLEPLHLFMQISYALPFQILQYHRNPVGGSHAGDGGRFQHHRHAVQAGLGQLSLKLSGQLRGGFRPFAPVLELNVGNAGAGSLHAVEDVEPHHGSKVLHGGILEGRLKFFVLFIGNLQGGIRLQDQAGQQKALVFIRKKAAGNALRHRSYRPPE